MIHYKVKKKTTNYKATLCNMNSKTEGLELVFSSVDVQHKYIETIPINRQK